MDLEKRAWLSRLAEEEGVSVWQLPDLQEPEEIAGHVTRYASECTGFVPGTPVLCGQGDAGATTSGAGVVHPGYRYMYVRTTGRVATTTSNRDTRSTAIFPLAHLSNQ